MKKRFRALWLFLALIAASIPTRATAQSRDAAAAAAAQQLFEEGRSLIAQGRHAEACPKLAESHRLDPGAGTLLNLGECYEHIGKVASAWATYREAESLAKRAGQRERATHCAARAESMSRRLSYLTITVKARASGLAVRRDGEVVAEPVWGTAVPVDGGRHVVEVSAPGHRPWKQVVQVSVTSDRVSIAIPELERLPPGAGPPPPEAAPSRVQRTIGWVTLGVGAVALGTGFAFGAVAKSNNDEGEQYCSAVDCEQRGIDLIRDAKDASTLSTAFVIAGGALAVGGVVLVLTAPSRSSTAVTASVRGAGIDLKLTW